VYLLIVMVPSDLKLMLDLKLLLSKSHQLVNCGIPLKVSFPNTEPVVAPGSPPVVSGLATIAFKNYYCCCCCQLTGFAPTHIFHK
jgi:hypothetical protein